MNNANFYKKLTCSRVVAFSCWGLWAWKYYKNQGLEWLRDHGREQGGSNKHHPGPHINLRIFFPKFWWLNSGVFFQQGLKLVRGSSSFCWPWRGERGRKPCKNRGLGSKEGLQKNGPERDGGKKLTSGPRHRRAVDRVSGRKKGQKWGHSLTLGVGRSGASFILNFQKWTRNTGGKWGHFKNCSGAMRKRVPHINLWKCKIVVPELAWQHMHIYICIYVPTV